ncbi:MAG: tetratricopeptide repeat protein, partial [Anaerolineales bacterium]|nr:tetratricopeptide repeat protein [Anaerolineales bacterium]
GTGGMGKTRLSLAVAERRRHDYLNGIYFVPLARASTAQQLPLAVAQALGISLHSLRLPQEQIINYLREKELLLILDNLEHLVDEAAEFVQVLLERVPLAQVLATSREKLNLRSEWVVPVTGLAYPAQWRHTAVLATYPAVALFVAAAQRVRPDFALGEEVDTAVVELCQLLDGVPLALELAGAAMLYTAPAQLVQQLQQTLDVLDSNLRDLPRRHRSLRAVFADAWQHLPADLQAILPQLAIFPGAFSRPAATAVSRATPRQLSQLAAHALLQHTGRDRYEVHPLIREYAAEQKTDTAVHDRFTRYFASEATHLMALMPSDQSTAWEDLLRQESNLRTAWALALTPADPARLEPLGEALAFLYAESGEFRRGLALFDTAVGHLDLADPFTDPPLGWDDLSLARLLLAYSRFLFYTQQHGRARQLIQTLLPVLRRHGTPTQVALALRGLSVTASNDDEALAHELESLALFRQAGEPWQVARSLINLAVAEGHKGDMQQANARHDEAIALLRQLGDQLELARALEYRGELARLAGDYPLALALMQESLRLCRTSEDRDGLQRVLFNL